MTAAPNSSHLRPAPRPVLAALILICLGVFPAIHITALQLALLVMLIGLGLNLPALRATWRGSLAGLGRWPAIAIAQFLVMLLINALVFASWEGNTSAGRTHYRAVALESWSVSLVVLLVLLVWLPVSGITRAAWIRWLPAGLMGAFAVGTGFYLFTEHQGRVWMWTPNPLVPPLWFLILTLLSFCWWEHMARRQRVLRLALFGMAGLMAVYGGARIIMIAWVVVAPLLGLYLYRLSPPQARGRARLALLGAALAAAALIWLGNWVSSGFLALRFAMFVEGPFTYEALSAKFERISVWPAAWSVARDNLWLGVGQINERVAIHDVLGWDRWYRAHQTYLSWLIGGGVPLLISGLIFKAVVLGFLGRAMMPAFLGLGVVLTLNELTDSVMQSAVAVQVVMVLVMILSRLQTQETDHG